MGTECEKLLKSLADFCFDFCREDKRFIELTNELKKYA